MLDIYLFYAIAALTVISSLFIFVQRKLIYAVIALTAAFLGSSLLFLLLGQTLVAMLQLIVFIGGLSTYMIVAVSSEEKNSKMIKLPIFAIVFVLLLVGLSLTLGYVPSQSQNNAPSFLNAASSAFQSQYPTLYLIVIMLFAITISGTLIIKKFVRLIV